MKKEKNKLEVITNDDYCKWECCDFGMMGIHDYEYVTSCGKNYDSEKTNKENYCPNCGKKII